MGLVKENSASGNTFYKKKGVDWDKKDRNMMLGGIGHDAATVTAALVEGGNVQDALKLHKELFEGMVKIRDEFEK